MPKRHDWPSVLSVVTFAYRRRCRNVTTVEVRGDGGDSGRRRLTFRDVGGFPVAEHARDHVEVHVGTDCNLTATVGDLRAMESKQTRVSVSSDHAEPDVTIEFAHGPSHPQTSQTYETILLIGSSMMPVAPASLSAGIKVLMPVFEMTVSTAKPSSP